MNFSEPEVPDLMNPSPPIKHMDRVARDPFAVQVWVRTNMAQWYGAKQGFARGEDGLIRSPHHETSFKLWTDFYNQFRNRIWEDYWRE